MHRIENLKIRGHRGEAVANTFFRQTPASDHVAIAFPGVAYTCHMPLLYYQTQLLLARGADVLWVEYGHTWTSPVGRQRSPWPAPRSCR